MSNKKQNMKEKEVDWVIDLTQIIQDFSQKNNVRTSQMLGYLGITLCGTMAMQDYTDEFAKETFNRLFEMYLKKKKEFNDDTKQYLFSNELRKRMSKFGEAPIEECLRSKEFWTELALYGGMSREKIEEIMNTKNEKKENLNKMTEEEFHDYLEKMIEDSLPDIIKSMENRSSE